MALVWTRDLQVGDQLSFGSFDSDVAGSTVIGIDRPNGVYVVHFARSDDSVWSFYDSVGDSLWTVVHTVEIAQREIIGWL